jgi:hypothetical protein
MRELVTLKFKGPEGERCIRDVAMIKRDGTCQCPKELAEKIVAQDPEGWEIVTEVKTKKGKDE